MTTSLRYVIDTGVIVSARLVTFARKDKGGPIVERDRPELLALADDIVTS